jgi:hypothetical protein
MWSYHADTACEPGVELSALLAGKLPGLAELVVGELRAAGHVIGEKSA